MLSSETTSQKAGCHERTSPAESGWNRSTVPAPAHTHAPLPHPPYLQPPPAPSSRTGWPAGSSTSPRCTNSPNGSPAPGRSTPPSTNSSRRAPPWSAPGAAWSSWNPPTDSVRARHHRPRARPRRTRPHRDRAAQRPHARYGRILDGLPRRRRRRRPDLMADPGASTRATARSPPASATRPATAVPARASRRRGPGSAPPSGSTTRPAEPVERQRHLVGLYIRLRGRTPGPAGRTGAGPRPGGDHRRRTAAQPTAPGRPESSSPSATAPDRAAAATGTTRCRCPRARSARRRLRHRLGPGAVAAMGRLRARLRAYAVMEGEDPVAVLSDLELLLRAHRARPLGDRPLRLLRARPAQDRAGRRGPRPAADHR